MAGHNRWKQIKHKKAATDVKRSQLFAKLLKAVSVAARTEPNPGFNPRLRTALEKAREANVPNENIERAVKKTADGALEDLTLEAYGPGGIALIIEVITDSRNRTISEIKQVLKEHGGKWADPGSVAWAFEKTIEEGETVWRAKFPQALGDAEREKLEVLLETLEEHDDVQNVFVNWENDELT